MVTPTLKATVDGLNEAERRDLLHYLEQTVPDDIELLPEQIEELERCDAEITSGAVAPLSVDDLVQRVRTRLA